jgi:hypothetical protein
VEQFLTNKIACPHAALPRFFLKKTAFFWSRGQLNALISQAEPFFTGEAGLAQQPGEEAWANVALVFVRDNKSESATAHLLVLSAQEGALEAEFA